MHQKQVVVGIKHMTIIILAISKSSKSKCSNTNPRNIIKGKRRVDIDKGGGEGRKEE